MRVVVNLHNSAGVLISRNYVPDNLVYSVSLPTDYLIAKGQSFDFAISASVDWEVDPAPGEDGTGLVNGTHVSGISVGNDYHDQRQVPSDEPLYSLLRRVVQHDVDFPSHGAGCICMDDFSRELKRHITAAQSPEPVTEAEHQAETPAQWQARMRAKERIRHVLHMAVNHL